jgi:hypothetical protein
MSGAVTLIFVLAITAMIGLFGFTGIVAPIAKAAILLVPAIFTVSLVIGFASRRQSWFR